MVRQVQTCDSRVIFRSQRGIRKRASTPDHYVASALKQTTYSRRAAPTILVSQPSGYSRESFFYMSPSVCVDFAASRSSKQVPIRGTDHRRLLENCRVTRKEDCRSELQFLHEVELGDSTEHVNRLVDFGEAPEGGLLSLTLRVPGKIRWFS